MTIRNYLIALLFVLGSVGVMQGQVLYSEDFDAMPLGNITTVTASYPHFIDNNTGCVIADGWRVDNDDLYAGIFATNCVGCNNNYAEIDYGSGTCFQDAILVTGSFNSPTSASVEIYFDMAYSDFSATDFFVVTLYNRTNTTYEDTLLGPLTANTAGFYNAFHTVTPGDDYELRFHYFGNDDFGASVDNIIVQVDCAPTATFVQTCNSSDLTYDLDITITSLNGADSVDIGDSINVWFSGVGLGTYSLTGINDTFIYIVNADVDSCFAWYVITPCDPCNLTSAPTDDCASAPLVNLSQPFFGSTDCGYTATNDGVGTDLNGPDNFCGSIENDSWLRFVAADDSVRLDWDVTGGSSCNTGVQFAVFDGVCTNYDGMTSLECYNAGSGSGIGDSGIFQVSGLTIGNTYYIYIDGYAGDLCEYSWTPVSGVSILPDGDTCEAASSIACGETDTADILQATLSDTVAGCGSGGTPGKGVWYTFTGNGGTYTISTDNPETNFDTQINIYTGTCGSLTCIAGDDDGGTGTTSEVVINTANGTTYYVYVDGDGAAEGTFEISLECSACAPEVGTWD